MKEIRVNGFEMSDKPLEEGDVAVVIRKSGKVETVVKSQTKEGECSASTDDILTGFALCMLAAQPNLMLTARQAAFAKATDAQAAVSLH